MYACFVFVTLCYILGQKRHILFFLGKCVTYMNVYDTYIFFLFFALCLFCAKSKIIST